MSTKIQLNLQKAGEAAPTPFRLNLNKANRAFCMELEWTCHIDHDPSTEGETHIHDLDPHVAVCRGGKLINGQASLLSTHNTKRFNPQQGILATNPDGSFGLPDGSLVHSGDKLEQGNKETIWFYPDKMPAGAEEAMTFVTVYERPGEDEEHHEHHEEHGEAEEGTFGEIEMATLRFLDSDGKELVSYVLSKEFAPFNMVQPLNVMIGAHGEVDVVPVGRGIMGDLNTALQTIS